MKMKHLAKAFRVEHGKHFKLKDFDPGSREGIKTRADAEASLQQGVLRLRELQNELYAQDRWGVLLILQGMDAAGKDSTIKHVMSGVNPQGCQVYSFKTPSAEELDHDFMWRNVRRLPERGRIGIFNRSYYEEVLVVRVHPELLQKQKIPPQLIGDGIWEERFQDIRGFEHYLARNGYVILKFFLNISRKEQAKRFLARLEEPEKYWKFSPADLPERARWNDYMAAYEDMIRNTATPNAPWFVVPADHKWFARLVVASAIVDALEDLKLAYPKVDEARKKELRRARKLLEQERSK